MNIHVFAAVFRRNFVSYFANPTGYVFICLFVLASSIAAFWLPDFFNNNLASLDQLSYWFPLIMVIYIPTVTMSIWADERKQGTDELLLTIPATDFDIVLGKYLAAVAIFVVSLVFSMLCNVAVLLWLGKPDLGLLAANGVGYLMVGLAMLAVGMVGSFLTGNITIGFVLGVLLNVPLVFLAWIGAVFAVFSRHNLAAIESWSLLRQFADFGRGVLSLAGFAFFLTIVVVMLYVSMTLIGRRHWFTGPRRWWAARHYAIRTLALAAAGVGLVLTLRHHDARLDLTAEQISSLSDATRDLIGRLETKRPVQIEAFISPSVPEKYVQAQQNLRDVLRELQAVGGNKIRVEIHDTDRFTQEAALAKKLYGIEPREVTTLNHGTLANDHIFLHVAVKCGLQSVPRIFIDQDTPVEYALVHAISTVSQQQRKKLGVVSTDAQLFGGFSMQGMTPGWPIIDELEKQYDVVRIDPSKPIVEKTDALMVVQPSTLGPQEMENFIAVVRTGRPTLIFEDPAPIWCSGLTPTSVPYRQSGGNMFMPAQQLPKGDIQGLWDLLGVDFDADRVVWQNFNPYPKLEVLEKNPEFVFVGPGSGARQPFGTGDPISHGLQQVLFPFPGAFAKQNTSNLKFAPLAETSEHTGTVRYRDLALRSADDAGAAARMRVDTRTAYKIAAHIQDTKPTPGLSVVLVADVDMISQIFFQFRDQSELPELGVHFQVDNITFVLNAIDELAGDHRFVELRKRRPQHPTLSHIDQWIAEDKQKAVEAIDNFSKKLDEEDRKEQETLEKKYAALQRRTDLDASQKTIDLLTAMRDVEREKQVRTEQLRQEKNRKRDEIETELTLKIRALQGWAKLMAVALPPILPLLVAVTVFLARRTREREGVARSRLR
jgi:ABC-2 type transport system permease protein